MRLFEGTPWDRPPTCERCGRLESECGCPPPTKPTLAPQKQTAKLAIEKRRMGKVVTTIRGLSSADNDLKGLLAKLKNACGAGGALDGDTLEIQGNQLERLRGLLSDIGYKVRG